MSKTLRKAAKSGSRLALMALYALLMVPRTTFAHPMGNFSINHYSRLVVGGSAIEIDYIIDMAEIPTFQEMQEDGLVTRLGDPALMKYLTRQAELMKARLTLEVDGYRLALECYSRQAIFPPGAGGLPTMKMGFIYRAQLLDSIAAAPVRLRYGDDNFPGRAGWKEIIAISGPGAVLSASSVPSRDRSVELTNYPTDMLHSPPQTLEATATFKAAPPGGQSGSELVSRAGWLAPAAMRLEANRQGTPRSVFTDLVKSRRLDATFLLMAALIAAVLGGFHALEPGHGKTLVAAYLVSSHGKARHAVLLGGIVTASHTISVYALGAITLFASQWIVPEQIYPWLGAASGLLVAGLGLALFLRRYWAAKAAAEPNRANVEAGRAQGGDDNWRQHHSAHASHQHPHHHHHGHHHEGKDGEVVASHRHTWWGGHVSGVGSEEERHLQAHVHEHGPTHPEPGSDETSPPRLSLKGLFALGITGGIVPCPAALVVLLAALAFHRVAFGLFLIVAFSAGLALVLIGLGLGMVYAGRLMSRFSGRGPLVERWLPLASSAVITVVGVALFMQSLKTAGLLSVRV
jgi:nickel/cobalt transporter (NicO) family protein